jgi:trigger factor
MEITSNKINSANAEIQAIVSIDEVNAKVEKIAKQISKTANIQGFRKGKVPVAIVKKQYGQKLVEDAEAESLREVLASGLAQLEIMNESLIGEPAISKFEKSTEKIEMTIKVAMRPTIDLQNVSSFVADFEKPQISDAEVDARIADLVSQYAPLINVEEDRGLELGDTAIIDFEGFIDGVAFSGGKAENFALALGSGQFIPGFEEQLVGSKRDTDVTVNVAFPADYNSKELAGKDAEFKVKVHQIQVKEVVSVDDEFAKKMLPGDESADVAKLREQVKLQMESEALGKLYNDTLKPTLLNTLVDALVFDLPEFVVEQEIDMAVNKKAGTMSEDEINELRENVEKLNELRETFRTEAQESVRATFIIDALAQSKKIRVEEQEVMQTIYYEAMQMGQDPQKAYDHYKASGYIPAIQMSIVEDKVLSTLLNEKLEA